MDTVLFDLNHLPQAREDLSLALGNFDGFHAGHQRLFVETSLHAKGDAAALVFDEPFYEGPYLSNVQDKKRYALSSRLDALYVLQGAKEVYSLSAEEFIEKVLLPLGTRRVVVGEDFRFGKGAAGDPELLKRYFDVDVVPLLTEEGEKVSSTAIKKSLLEGDILRANKFLGRPYEISGKVVEGLHNGAKIGFPTANVSSSFPYVLPKSGVYAGVVYLLGKAYRAMINVGTNPTIGVIEKPLVEAHILDYEGDCYDAFVYVAFLAFIREEARFDDLAKLAQQLRKDEKIIRDLLA